MPVIAVLCVTLQGCGARRPIEVDGPRRAARTAIKLVRARSPHQARYIEHLVADAEIATAAEQAAPWWRPQTGRGGNAWLRVVVASRDAARDVRGHVGQARARYTALIDDVQHEVARARAEIREAGMGRREAAALQRALLSLGVAPRFAAAGEFERAADKLLIARDNAAIVHREWASVHARFGDSSLRRQWREWVDETLEESRDRQDFAIIVDKLQRRLHLYYRGLKMVSFAAELGANGLRQKQHAGDRATPEGRYRIVEMKQNHSTKYYKALLIDYPNEDDRERYVRGKQHGTIPYRAGIGNLIEIHGEGGEGRDWTDGCVALTNAEMDKLFARVHVGTPVTIVGTYEY